MFQKLTLKKLVLMEFQKVNFLNEKRFRNDLQSFKRWFNKPSLENGLQ